MVFSSIIFLFLFLPTILLLVYPLPRKAQNVALLAASAVFYIWGAGEQTWIILSVSLVSWLTALGIFRLKDKSGSSLFFLTSLLVVAGPLLAVKYIPVIQSALDNSSAPAVLYLPLGISFFTFHAISYVVDVRQGKIEPSRNIIHYLLYLFVFPHQIAGPIVRFSEIKDEIAARLRPTTDDVLYGLSRFGWGLAKKTIIADNAGAIAAAAWSQDWQIDTKAAWLGAAAYTVQIYFDFSGYSDMALGLARVFGFHFPENFAGPYRSRSATEFWARWHMTLSRWFRDYVYIPLGGNRHGRLREYAALLITFATTSLWHGATWTFLIWGGLWSGLLLIERITGLRNVTGWSWLRRPFMIAFIIVSWVPFRSPSTDSMMNVWNAMFHQTGIGLNPIVTTQLTPIGLGAVAIGLLTFLLPQAIGKRTFDFIALRKDGTFRRVVTPFVGLFALVGGATFSLWSSFSPFLYYQF